MIRVVTGDEIVDYNSEGEIIQRNKIQRNKIHFNEEDLFLSKNGSLVIEVNEKWASLQITNILNNETFKVTSDYWIYGWEISPNNNFIVIYGEKFMSVKETFTNRLCFADSEPSNVESRKTVFSSDSTVLAIVKNNKFTILSTDNFEEMLSGVIEGLNNSVMCTEFFCNGSKLIVVSEKIIFVIDIQNEEQQKITIRDSGYKISVSPNGRYGVIYDRGDDYFICFDVVDCKIINDQKFEFYINCMGFTMDSNFLIIISESEQDGIYEVPILPYRKIADIDGSMIHSAVMYDLNILM